MFKDPVFLNGGIEFFGSLFFDLRLFENIITMKNSNEITNNFSGNANYKLHYLRINDIMFIYGTLNYN